MSVEGAIELLETYRDILKYFKDGGEPLHEQMKKYHVTDMFDRDISEIYVILSSRKLARRMTELKQMTQYIRVSK